MRTVYLAGPVLGRTKEQANGWRHLVSEALREFGIRAISPLRCEPVEAGSTYGPSYKDERFGSARAIKAKNLFDVASTDLTLAYLPAPAEGQHQSYGTLLEIGWAHALRKPVVLVSNDPTVINHPVIGGSVDWLLSSLDAGVDVVEGILGGYAIGGRSV